MPVRDELVVWLLEYIFSGGYAKNPIIAAVEAHADCIISGDAHLKDLGEYQGIPILTPADFVTKYDGLVKSLLRG